MRSAVLRRLGASLLAVAVLAAGLAGETRTCRQCAPSCPMHAKKPGCHHGARPSCHREGGPMGFRAACGHRADPALQAVAMRALFCSPAASGRAVVARRVAVPEREPDLGVAPEPPTEPPRAPAVG